MDIKLRNERGLRELLAFKFVCLTDGVAACFF